MESKESNQQVSVRFYTPKVSCKVMKPLKVCKIGGARVVRIGATKQDAVLLGKDIRYYERIIRQREETRLWREFQNRLAVMVYDVLDKMYDDRLYRLMRWAKGESLRTRENKKSVHLRVIKSRVFNPAMADALSSLFPGGEEQ